MKGTIHISASQLKKADTHDDESNLEGNSLQKIESSLTRTHADFHKNTSKSTAFK